MKKLLITIALAAPMVSNAALEDGQYAQTVAQRKGFTLTYDGAYQTQLSAADGEAKLILTKEDGQVSETCFTAYTNRDYRAKQLATEAFRSFANMYFPNSLEAMLKKDSFDVDGISVFGGAVFKEKGMYVWGHYTSTYQQVRMCAANYDVRSGYTANSKSIPLVKF